MNETGRRVSDPPRRTVEDTSGDLDTDATTTYVVVEPIDAPRLVKVKHLAIDYMIPHVVHVGTGIVEGTPL